MDADLGHLCAHHGETIDMLMGDEQQQQQQQQQWSMTHFDEEEGGDGRKLLEFRIVERVGRMVGLLRRDASTQPTCDWL